MRDPLLALLRADLEAMIRRVDEAIEQHARTSPDLVLTHPTADAAIVVEAAARRVMFRLNALRAEGVRGSRLGDAQHVLALLRARPNGEAECYQVLEHMAAEAREKSEWKWLNSETPFRLAHFERRLADAQADAAKRGAPPVDDDVPDWLRRTP